jgi:glycosyltransferase involved in cell wall biosynthesis
MAKKVITIVYNTACYVYKFRINLIRALEKLGYKVIVISPYDEYVDKLAGLGIAHHPIKMSQYGMNPIHELKTTVELYKAFKKYNPDFSLHYTIKPNIFGGIAARMAGINVINNIAGAGKAFSNEESFFSKFIASLYKFGLSKSQKVFFQNNDDMTLFLNKNLVAESQSERIPGSGVELEKYKTPDILKMDNSFLFVGRLLIEKGIIFYLDAALEIINEHPDCRFGIVGELENNKDYIDKALLDNYLQYKQITYIGTVLPDLMPQVIEGYSCITLPSYYREGVPRSLLEAASFSKAIITTDSVGCRDVVDEGLNGFLCDIKDVKSIVTSMKKYIALSDDDKAMLGRNGRVKMENEFDEKFVLNAYVQFIEANQQ